MGAVVKVTLDEKAVDEAGRVELRACLDPRCSSPIAINRGSCSFLEGPKDLLTSGRLSKHITADSERRRHRKRMQPTDCQNHHLQTRKIEQIFNFV